MEPSRERKFSPVWEHFNLISANKVKCRLCSKELRYNNNTSSMLRHYWALHETKETGSEQPSIDDRSGVDDALVDMVILDSQPFSFVEDKGFKKLVAALNPGYVLPTRQALKAMVEKRYEELKEKAKVLVSTASAVSLTSDMWTSINTNAYLAVTGHFIDTSTTLQTVVLGVVHFPQSHTAENLAQVKSRLMLEWGITDRVTCLVTDGAPNMGACSRHLQLRHTNCVAHTLNLFIKKAIEQNPVLSKIHIDARRLVGYFKSSTTAKERLSQMQVHMGQTTLKLVQEVDTRWNSTFHMLQRLHDMKEPVAAALAGLRTEIAPLTMEQL
ncbi:zinc finger BED domain-containing protein 4-like [Synchiropus splendidus]|uniref:zinc finger BED domain-containing protein 4-like n=1 Tax=Synchiropus splendidus TaxID=270530 RepID=UPI00237E418F|nr:zinc finger BED domain-containing protein 4-like [Synchiropus splendidus]